jgi:hypothetical protein
LNPSDTNVPVSFDSNPLVRSIANRGRIYLEYDDPILGDDTWIPADVELEENNLNGSVVVLRPVGVLPNNAEIRVIVEQTVEDISGESNVADLSYNRIFGSFRTQRSYEQQFNGIVETFSNTNQIDFEAPFAEPLAEVGPGYVKAGFSFEGRSTSLEFEPAVGEVVLNTAFTQVVPKAGLPFNVSGGVFNFKNVTIPQGVSVKGQGPNPMVWLCSGDFRVGGELSVRGGNGARVDTLNSANFAKAGGIGICSGGNGGDGTPSGTKRDLRGASGNGPLQVPGLGGTGGRIACTTNCYTGSGYAGNGGGSGGGGGTLATQGDPRFDTAVYTGTTFQQKRGFGGAGCSGSAGRPNTLPGGDPAPLVFTDARADNNFWGAGINFATNLRIAGELSVPMGGGGGGGGGDTSYNTNCSTTDQTFTNDYSGGGGGGGGGVLIVKALGEIEILPTGMIIADGGNGGGGEQVGSCGEAGGGGAGSGGMVILMSAKRIILHAHSTNGRYLFRGPTAVDKDYNFSITADGGVCTTGSFTAPVVSRKYPASGQAVMSGTLYDTNPLGGFGGMGIVQLMVPPGDNSDNTNTALDDNIEVRLPQNPPAGVNKQSIIGWRGHPNAAGTVFTDDNGVPFVAEEGDIRPAPTLMPVPFNAKSRVRSKWLDTGASQRRALAADDGQPRGLVTTGSAQVGPNFQFAGIDAATGYVEYQTIGQTGTSISYPTVVGATAIASTSATATYLGVPCYSVTLASAVLGTQNEYSQFELEMLGPAGSLLGSFRILSHTDSTLLLAPEANVLPANAVQARVQKKLFKIVTSGGEGLGPVYLPTGSSTPIPTANVRFGFAFHQEPVSDPLKRYPLDPKQFIHDMNDTGLQNWIQLNGAPRYLQWDVTFDASYQVNGSVPPSLSPESPLPILEFLRIPFTF